MKWMEHCPSFLRFEIHALHETGTRNMAEFSHAARLAVGESRDQAARLRVPSPPVPRIHGSVPVPRVIRDGGIVSSFRQLREPPLVIETKRLDARFTSRQKLLSRFICRPRRVSRCETDFQVIGDASC
jgi:hypothetical protein